MTKKVAYITSGKTGLHRFTFNELVLLEEKGIDFNLCLTQLNKGTCMPKESWTYYTASKLKAIKQFLKLLITKPAIFKSFFEAKKENVLSYFFMSLSIYSDIKSNDITSLHCQMGDDKLYIGYFLKKMMNIPLSVTVHAHELYKRKVYDENDTIKKLYASCDKVITISEFNTKIINDKFGVNNEDIKVMRLFPDIDSLNYVKDKAKILIVANWAEKKGYDVLLKALKKIDRDDYALWVVGGSYYSENSIDVEKLVKEYQMEDKVAILGRQGNPILDILFYACDIFCLPSYTEHYKDGNPAEREGIPVSIMEAMAWGKPVIATKHAGNPELVKDILVKENDVDDLASALKYMLENRDKWKEMGKRNQEIIRKDYTKLNIETLVTTINNF